MNHEGSRKILVQVVEIDSGREIRWGASLAEQLGERVADIRAAITSGSEVVAQSLASIASVEGWSLDEVSASFGITLTAEAGVILSKASAGSTFDVTVKFTKSGK